MVSFRLEEAKQAAGDLDAGRPSARSSSMCHNLALVGLASQQGIAGEENDL